MAMTGGIDTFVLQEFRLRAADSSGDAARIVAGFSTGTEPTVPLLTSIVDRRDVATIRALQPGEHADADEHAALDPLVAHWEPAKHYGSRITERSERLPSHYRLAVTESGINIVPETESIPRAQAAERSGTAMPLSLLWIGAPLGTHAGLVVLVGDEDARVPTAHDPQWPNPLSGELGVRIYDSGS